MRKTIISGQNEIVQSWALNQTQIPQITDNTPAEVIEVLDRTYSFVQLDPRPNAINPDFDIWIEITDQKLAGDKPNLDHHWEWATCNTPSSCEQALTMELPKAWIKFATIRADWDSLTAMAILQSRLQGREINIKIVEAIWILDRLWIQWLEQKEEFTSLKLQTTSILRIAPDFKSPLEKRVEDIQKILEWSFDIEEMKKMSELRDKEFSEAKANSKVELKADWRIASVISTHRFATTLWYEFAPIVVATNPEMLDPKSWEKYNKHTICRYNEFVEIDLEKLLKKLNKIEPGWGGRWDIIWSPMWVSSKLSNEEVVGILEEFIITEGVFKIFAELWINNRSYTRNCYNSNVQGDYLFPFCFNERMFKIFFQKSWDFMIGTIQHIQNLKYTSTYNLNKINEYFKTDNDLYISTTSCQWNEK